MIISFKSVSKSHDSMEIQVCSDMHSRYKQETSIAGTKSELLS